MATNPFADPYGDHAYDNAWNRMEQIRTKRADTQAAPLIASGDDAGAAKAYGAAGLPQQARQLSNDATATQNTAYEHGRQQKQDQLAESEKRVKTLSQAASGLQSIPVGHRVQALKAAYPLFQAAGIDTSHFDGLTEDQLTDESLTTFRGELEKQWQFLALTNGGAARTNPHTGEFKVVRQPDPPPVIVGNGAVAFDRQTGRPIYSNPRTFAPPRAAAGGGLPGLPPGYRPK